LTNLNTVSKFLARIILIRQCIKALENLAQHFKTVTLSKMSFTDKDGHLTKAFQKEKHDAASELLKKHANRNS